ncbi:putative phosphatase regulatory subunit-domain-containing protein [Mycena amicta]|nr:putative phosphatase regulatory subunit-domain-containing protein [Mycena amicta]
MPYIVPGVAAPPPPTPAHNHNHAGRPGHRRSYTFDDESRGPGAFSSLGALPRRPQQPPRSPKRFHFRADDEDGSSSSSDEQQQQQQQQLMPAWSPKPTTTIDDDEDGPPPPLRLRQTPAFRLTPPRSPTTNLSAVPFPRSSSPSSPLSPAPTRPPLPGRASSTPVILLANGKPLKSSLKSSRSAPHVPGHSHHTHHLRARSAPSTPSLSPPTPGSPDEGTHDPAAFADALGLEDGVDGYSPTTPKAVHFPPPDKGLETVRVFRRGARPASVSFPLGVDDETETETETDSGMRYVSASGLTTTTRGRSVSSPLNPTTHPEPEWRYVLSAPGIPRQRDASSMVVLESVWLEEPPQELNLRGTLLVRNAAFEKHVFVRFTLDGWCTTSEVGARYLASVDSHDEPGPGWDRFEFVIRLTDYAHQKGGKGLVGRELVLVAKFFVPWVQSGGVGPYVWADTLVPSSPSDSQKPRQWIGTGGGGQGEWWDNNAGKDYRVGFRAEDVKPKLKDVDRVPFPILGTTTSGPGPPPAGSLPSVPGSVSGSGLIPFPTSSASASPSPSPSALSPSPPSTSTSTSAPQMTLAIPPPPPPPRTAQAQALAAKLGRLSLRNYAAPVQRPSSWAGTGTAGTGTAAAGTATAAGMAGTARVKEGVKKAENEQQRERETEGDKDKDKDKTPPTTGTGTGTSGGGVLGLYWPWGRTATSPPPPLRSSSSADTTTEHEHDSSDSEGEHEHDSDPLQHEKEQSEETPPTSPLGANGLLGLLEESAEETKDETGSKEEGEGEHKEEEGGGGGGGGGGGEGEKTKQEQETSTPETQSSIYQAFVRQWCFAGAGGGVGGVGAGR